MRVLGSGVKVNPKGGSVVTHRAKVRKALSRARAGIRRTDAVIAAKAVFAGEVVKHADTRLPPEDRDEQKLFTGMATLFTSEGFRALMTNRV